ncbi:MAG: excinuclease subunit [Chlamydiales bacterium]|jgi:excinuclease ABC subunit B|nr:excinuclease subunit [Chlamydiales bacterium]
MRFKLVSNYSPCGDQPEAIETLVKGVKADKRFQVLLGVTGSGKTFTMANVVEQVQKPTLVIAHNKTLAAQLYHEFKAFFPENAVEYFVSYYDYYQPEAYIARTDTFIEKDLAINDRIDKMRLSATRALLERPDVLIVASVSCIYGLGSPEYYKEMNLTLEVNKPVRRDDVLLHLVEMQYKRNDFDFTRATFRVRGDTLEVFPAYEEDLALRIEFFGDEIERISEIDPLTGKVLSRQETVTIYPGSHHVTPEEVRLSALESIRRELQEQVAFFQKEGRLIEAQRISERTNYDMEIIKEVGFCKGIENYSRHFSKRKPGDCPSCLIDYFPEDFLMIIDESHQTIPQLRAMYNGDKARKRALIDFGFRLPSAYDNRPLAFEETYKLMRQAIFVSATPAEFEVQESEGLIARQVIRPTGLLDPEIEIRKADTQVDDCLEEIRQHVAKNERVLVTTLTKKLSEELTKYLIEVGVKAKYLHSDIDTIERVEIIKDLRRGVFDVLVGINLLREGLDIPEVSLVAILDADKEGFLRSATALIQTCGRAARNAKGRVIMYADRMTKSILQTIDTTLERRRIQAAYNEEHGIEPTTVSREIAAFEEEEAPKKKSPRPKERIFSVEEAEKKIKELEKAMRKAAKSLQFEEAARLRDELRTLQEWIVES